jgi:hypothetical protein
MPIATIYRVWPGGLAFDHMIDQSTHDRQAGFQHYDFQRHLM